MIKTFIFKKVKKFLKLNYKKFFKKMGFCRRAFIIKIRVLAEMQSWLKYEIFYRVRVKILHKLCVNKSLKNTKRQLNSKFFQLFSSLVYKKTILSIN